MYSSKWYKYYYVCHLIALVAGETVGTTQNVLPPDDAAEITAPLTTRNVDNTNIQTLCPNMLHYIFEGTTPRDGGNAGIFEEYGVLDEHGDMQQCLTACCQKNSSCNVVFAFKQKCYHVRCFSDEACMPKEHTQAKGHLQMILVSPVAQPGKENETISWLDVLKEAKNDAQLFPWEELNSNKFNAVNFWKHKHKGRYPSRNQETSTYDEDEYPMAEKRVKQLLLSPLEDGDNLTPDEFLPFNAPNVMQQEAAVMSKELLCNVDMPENRCPPKEECIVIRTNPVTAVCRCIRGYFRNELNECVQELDYQSLETGAQRQMVSAASETVVSTENKLEEDKPDRQAENNKKLVVSVASKEVQLPEKEVTLAAFTVPDELTSGVTYKYVWNLINQPKAPMNGTISDQSKSKVRLSNLSEGLYTFKVSVTGANGTYGETTANVTVLPEARINRVPQVVITPQEQIIRQPTMNAILDGSTSSDDDKIISWHWDLLSAPIGYQPKLPEVNTLQLTDLTSPGNYTFKLTVTDSDNVTNSTTANITVLKTTDYPPVANAGDAVILYLPNNNVTLNGTASSDDHEIVAWEWTKDANDEAKAVDMQNTRTPYVQLSNLEEGMYTFVLKVTDGSGQSSTAKVHVFVKPPTNSPPIAIAGNGNVTVNLPRNWAVLNGSRSSDDIGIQCFYWKQLSGPNNAVISNANTSVANATSLTLGIYQFELLVIDENNNSATDKTWVKIVQEKNEAPVANAGGDQSVTLPVSAIYLNGSKSSDDLAVVKYIWTREDSSLAAGVVVGNSDREPVLILTNLVHGRYVYKLTVSDEQGLTSSDTVSVIVHSDPMLMYLMQLTLPMGVSILTQSEYSSIIQKIGLLLSDMKIHVRNLQYDPRTEAVILVFYVEAVDANGKSNPVDGLSIEHLLKDKLQRDASILGTVFADVRTAVCQNKCSGHGVCNTDTRACICEAFWMPSGGYFWGIDDANCDWSILYVFVGIIATFFLLSGIFWAIACARKQTKKPRTRQKSSKVQKYSLIGTQDEEAPPFGRENSLTDSETDSDVLFETRTKANGILRLNGTAKSQHNHKPNKYPISKLGRKVKT